MSTQFPAAGLDTYPTLVDNTDDVLAAHANDRGDAIEAIEIKVGIDSSAVATSIDYFLKHASGAYRTHIHDGTSDDGALLDWDSCWSDAVHNHSSAAEGGTTLSNITSLTGANNLDIGAFELRAQTLHADVAGGTSPLTIVSNTLVSNLNADLLDGQEGSYYSNASNLGSGTVPLARISGIIGTRANKTIGTTYGPTATDGYVVAYAIATTSSDYGTLRGYTDGNSNPTTFGGGCSVHDSYRIHYAQLVMFVPKGDYYKVTIYLQNSGVSFAMYWVPLAS
jgi:hypothetical protein